MARVEMPNSRARSAIAYSSRPSGSALFTVVHLRLIFLPQFLLRQLADQGLGEGVPEMDLPRQLEPIELVGQELPELRLRRPRAIDELHEGYWRLAAAVVGHADDCAFVNRRMLGQRLLDGAGIDVEAGGDDQVLDPVRS